MTHFQHHIPKTKAYVDPTAFYHDSDVIAWLGSPQKTEMTFQKYHGVHIGVDYIETFERNLRKLHREIIDSNLPKDNQRKFMMSTAIFRILMFVDISNAKIMIKEIILRPCAAKHGFFKIILQHIARCCKLYQCDLYIENPLEVTSKLLDKYFRNVLQKKEMIDPCIGPNQEPQDYQFIEYKVLRKINFALRLGLIKEEGVRNRTDLIFLGEDPNTHEPYTTCVFGKFPLARALNYGPS